MRRPDPGDNATAGQQKHTSGNVATAESQDDEPAESKTDAFSEKLKLVTRRLEPIDVDKQQRKLGDPVPERPKPKRPKPATDQKKKEQAEAAARRAMLRNPTEEMKEA